MEIKLHSNKKNHYPCKVCCVFQERTRNAQFIIISLRNNMFELADRLVGIYKTDNCTKSVTVNPNNLILPLQEVNANS